MTDEHVWVHKSSIGSAVNDLDVVGINHRALRAGVEERKENGSNATK